MALLYQSPKFRKITRNRVVEDRMTARSWSSTRRGSPDRSPRRPLFYFTSLALVYNNPGAMALNTVSRFKTLVYISSNFISLTDRPRLDISYTLRHTICHSIRPRNLFTKSTIIPYPVCGITTTIICLLAHNSAVYQSPFPLPANNMLPRIASLAKAPRPCQRVTNRAPD
jgi:hypothetical protein